MSTAPIFKDLTETVLGTRKDEGVRGVIHEWNRYRTHIQHAAFAQKPVDDIKRRDIREWVRDMRLKTAKDRRSDRLLDDATIKRAYALVRCVALAAVDLDHIEHSFCDNVKIKKRAGASSTVDKWTVLSLEEQEAVASCTAIPIMARYAIGFALGTGLRQGEQFSLRIHDVLNGIDDPHVVVRYGGILDLPSKSGKMRRVPLLKGALEVTRQWFYELPTFAPENPLNLMFPTTRGRRRGVGKPLGNGALLRQYLGLVGITRRVRWHDLRHSAATNLLNGSLGRVWTLPEVRDFLGHSSVSMTEKYTHLLFADLAKAARATTATHEPMPIVSAIPAAPDTSPAFEIPDAPDTARELETWFEEEAVA
jgi:integrase